MTGFNAIKPFESASTPFNGADDTAPTIPSGRRSYATQSALSDAALVSSRTSAAAFTQRTTTRQG